MSLKLVLISPSGTLEKDGRLNTVDMANLARVIKALAERGVNFAIWSNQRLIVNPRGIFIDQYLSELAETSVQYVGMQIGMPPRQRKNSIDPILEKFGVMLHEVILVGAGDVDLQAGVNNQILLLRPAWYGGNLEYGFEIKSIEELARFCLLFGVRNHYFYWGVKDATREFETYALGPYSTYYEQFSVFGSDAMAAAKHEQGTLGFWHQLVLSTLYFSGLMHTVDYITVFPGHSSHSGKKEFHNVLDLLGKCFGKKFYPDLFVRWVDSEKSAFKKAGDRKFSNQINTLYVNIFPKKNLQVARKTPLIIKGKRVLVVDDICTSGRSLDTARLFLKKAGANTVLFSWLKTVNTDFMSIDQDIPLVLCGPNKIDVEPVAMSYGYNQNIIDHGAVEEIKELLERYKVWKI